MRATVKAIMSEIVPRHNGDVYNVPPVDNPTMINDIATVTVGLSAISLIGTPESKENDDNKEQDHGPP